MRIHNGPYGDFFNWQKPSWIAEFIILDIFLIEKSDFLKALSLFNNGFLLRKETKMILGKLTTGQLGAIFSLAG
jgi:hypothetical protein